MSQTFHPVTPAFFTALAPLSSDGRSSLVDSLDVVYHPRIATDRLGEWVTGTAAGATITGAVVTELHGSTANADGTFTNAAGARRGLYLTSAGACEPGNPPPN